MECQLKRSPGTGAPGVRVSLPMHLLPALLAGLLLLALPALARGQAVPPSPAPSTAPLAEGSCPAGEISRVFVDNHSVFDPASIPEDPRVRWAYRAANRIHVRTRPSFIRSELLLRPGDCYDPELARESARLLREFRFIAWADAYSVPQEDGTRHLVVETRDEWTTKIAGDVAFDGGIEIRGISLVEENFAGRGISLGAFYLEDDERRDVGGLFELPRAGRTNWDVSLFGSRTRVGGAWNQAVIHPFMGEVGTFAFRQRAANRTDLFTWVLDGEAPWSHLVVPLEVGRLEVATARRVGRPGAYFLLGGGVSREWVRPGAPEEVEGVRDGRFNDRTPVPTETAQRLSSQLRDRESTRVSLLAGARRIRFAEREGLDALRGVQDVAHGSELLLSLGPAVSSGAAVREGARSGLDVFGRTDLFAGFVEGPLVGQLHLAGQARRGGDPGLRDILLEGHAFLYHQHTALFPGTLLLRLAFQGGWDHTHPFQLTLGGPEGVRGLDERAFPGARRHLATLESRALVPSPLPDFFDLGSTLFLDVGSMRAGDTPWGMDSGVQASVGAGLRLGFPAGSSAVIRIDLAQPLGDRASDGPRLMIQAREWVGILGSFWSPQLARSQRAGVSPRFPGVNRVPGGG
jgi:hypothetical protein